MERNGWVRLHRKLLESAVFGNEKALKVWVWCLLKGSYKEHTLLIGRQKLLISKGQFVMGSERAVDELGLAKATIWYWLNFLEKEGQVRLERTTKYTVVTILNWSEYQEDLDTDETQKERWVGTYKKDKKEKKNTYPSQAQDSEEKHETLDPELYPPAKQKKEALPSVSDVLAIWNRYPDWKATGKTSAPVNQTAIRKLLPPAKLTDDLTASIMKKRNKYSLTQIEEGVKAYVVEIANRPKDNYQSHRFSAYEFFTYPNGLVKYANR